jgi:hypothetical protein
MIGRGGPAPPSSHIGKNSTSPAAWAARGSAHERAEQEAERDEARRPDEERQQCGAPRVRQLRVVREHGDDHKQECAKRDHGEADERLRGEDACTTAMRSQSCSASSM